MSTNANESLYGFKEKPGSSQFGGGLLPAIAAVGLVMVMTQGGLFYKAKTSNAFLYEERNKTMAQQAAEAGVEHSIADLGSRRLIVTNDMENYVASQNEPIGSGTFSTKLTTLAMGPDGDTVHLLSQGLVNGKDKKVAAKLRLHNAFDTNLVVVAVATPETTITTSTVTVTDTTYTETTLDPMTMPMLDATPAYAACLSSGGPKCQICHLTSSDVKSAFVIDVAKPSVWKHIGHHGDYVTTDGTCDIYNPVMTPTYTTYNKSVTDTLITPKITYAPIPAIDTLVKVEILSWR
jgi:hypothetical protein